MFEVETGKDVGRRGQIKMEFVEEECFKFEVKELWRDSKGCGFVECVIHRAHYISLSLFCLRFAIF